MPGNRLSLWLFVVLCCVASSAFAHKLAPSLLRITETGDNIYSVYWKTPAATVAGKSLQPEFPQGCRVSEAPVSEQQGSGVVWRWPMQCEGGLIGKPLSINGMAQTATATLVKIEWLDGHRVQQLLNAQHTRFVIPERQSITEVMLDYTVLGVEHIWSGIDHLLFVLALLLLVANTRLLIWTITSFTVGHSITLSLVILGYLDFPVSLVEFAIAASILVLAIELTKSSLQAGRSRWIPSHSWLVAIAFGLLHGMGFAGALKEVGLPYGDIPLALFSFNVGIEIGQVLFVLAALLLIAMGRRYLPGITRPGWWATVYSIGGLSAFWCIERGLAALTAA